MTSQHSPEKGSQRAELTCEWHFANRTNLLTVAHLLLNNSSASLYPIRQCKRQIEPQLTKRNLSCGFVQVS